MRHEWSTSECVMISILSVLSVFVSTSAQAADNPMDFVGDAHNTGVLEMLGENNEPSVGEMPALTTDLWISYGGDERYREEATEWFTVLLDGDAKAALMSQAPERVLVRYDEYMSLVDDLSPDNLSEVVADIEALDDETMKDFSGESLRLLLSTSAVLKSSSELWVSDEFSDEGSWDEDDLQYQWRDDGSGSMGLDFGEIAEADAEGVFVGGLAGVVAGSGVGGTLTLGTLTIPGAVVGGLAGVIAGSAGSSLLEYVKQDEVRDFVNEQGK